MTTRKTEAFWVVNVMLFICFSLLGATGLLNWLILPRGRDAGGGLLVSLRHLLLVIHEGVAVLFIGIVVVHLLLHWGYLKAHLKKYGKGR